MATIDKMTQQTPGSNEFHPGKVFNPAVLATMSDLASQNVPTAQIPGEVQTNTGTTPTEVNTANGQTVTPVDATAQVVDPTAIPDPNMLTTA